MNRRQFCSVVARKINMSENELERMLKVIKNSLIDILCKGQKIRFSNFGEFKVVEKNPRFVKNPITKRYFFTEKRKQIEFKSSKNFKFSVK